MFFIGLHILFSQLMQVNKKWFQSCDAWEKQDIICCLDLIPVIRPFFLLVENPASRDFLFQIPEEKNKLWHVD